MDTLWEFLATYTTVSFYDGSIFLYLQSWMVTIGLIVLGLHHWRTRS